MPKPITVFTLQEEITVKESEILVLKEKLIAQQNLERLCPEIALAEVLHSSCTLAHEDQCGYYYTSWADWLNKKSCSEKERYIAQARDFLAASNLSIEDAIKAVKTLHKY